MLQGQPDVESRRTKLPGYPQELREVEKNKKKFVRRAHLTISLLKPRDKEIREFPLYQIWAEMAMSQLKSSRIAISSNLPNFFPFFSKPPETSEYPSKLVDLSATSGSQSKHTFADSDAYSPMFGFVKSALYN